MPEPLESEALDRLAELNEHRSWADFGSVPSSHPLLQRYVASYTYSVGRLTESREKLITRAFPSIMTQIYFEFCGSLSEIRGKDHGFGDGQESVVIEKRTYIKQGLGSWFDIYQLPSAEQSRPIKNLKIDLYPITLYELFHCSPAELQRQDLQLSDLFGDAMASLMLEEMEAARTGRQLVDIAERYLLDRLSRQIDAQRLLLHRRGAHPQEIAVSASSQTIPRLPGVNDSLGQQALRHQKGERWLQKRFAEVYGLSFKQIQGNLRFHQAHQAIWRALSQGQRLNLTALAYSSGYFDQAHFIKEFKRYTGMTPGQYLKSNVDQNSQYLWFW